MRPPRQSRIRSAHVTVQALLLLASLVALTIWIAPTGFTSRRLAASETLSTEENVNSSGRLSSQAIPFGTSHASSDARSGFAQLMSSIEYLPTTTLPSLLSTWRSQDKKASEDGVWQDIEEPPLMRAQAGRSIVPKSYRTVRLNQNALMRLLQEAPMEFTEEAKSMQVVMTLPMPNGTFARFRIEESPIMGPELAAKFPEIKTYQGQGIDEPSATARFGWTQAGFHAIVLSERGTIYVSPYAKGDMNNYISYYNRDYQEDVEPFECLVSEAGAAPIKSQDQIVPNISSGRLLRKYDLALAATSAYTAFHGGTKALAQVAIAITINRVNAIYQSELAIRLMLINNTDIIYVNGVDDPYTNGAAETMLEENQENLDGRIGNPNYDIGHVFGTTSSGRSGVALRGTACHLDYKAYGVSLSSNPDEDNPTYITLLAHEMGHQFGASHTFNATTGGCGNPNQRAPSTAYEPGSGSTIMAYAGICGSQSLQTNSDDYFHAGSFDQIQSYVNSTSSCANQEITDNYPPTVSAGLNYTIPKMTPFRLTADGSDVNGETVKYSWEEFDSCLPQYCSPPDPSTLPNTDANGGEPRTRPIFRSFKWSTDPSRTFPDWSVLIKNQQGERYQQSLKGESLPTIPRPMLFRVTARDNYPGGGGVNSDDMQLDISNAGPFVVTQPNLATTWTVGSSQTIRWDVAGTSGAPVNCASVRISLSTDGGNSFTLVVPSTPNDGTHTITVLNSLTNGATGRILVEAIGNVFLNISQRFTITPGSGGGTDTTNPTVNITSPTGSTHATSGSTLTLRGRAVDNVGVTQVTCANSRGGSCTVSTALPNWIANVTGLQSGTNVLTVTARDAAGRAGSDTLTVTYTPPPTCGNGTSVNYRINGGPPLHPNGTLIKTSSDPTVYLIQSGQKRGIPSQAILNNLYPNGGFDFKDVITVASDEFSQYPTGAVVSGTLPSNGRNQPDGRLIQRPGSSEISIVTNSGQRRPFTSEGAFLGLGYLYCNVVSASDYDSYPAGPPADSSTVLSFSSIEPSPVQTRDWGEQVTYTFTVVDGNGTPVSGAVVGGQDNLRGIGVFLATPVTDSNGQGTYTTMVPNGASNAIYDLTFFADKSGYTESQGVTRQVVVSHTLTELVIASVEPSAMQTRDWGGSVSYTITVRDSNGNPVSGATIVGEDELRGTIFTTSPSSTNSGGQITYATTVPNGSPNLIYGISFIAQKPGFIESPIVSRQVQVNHFVDTSQPNVLITSPTSNPTYATNTSPLSMAGTASDNVGVTQVSWANDRGGSGTGNGTTNWSVSGIVLQSGTNVITVTAIDAVGNTGTATLTVTYTPAPTPTPTPTPTPSPTPTPAPMTIQFSSAVASVNENGGSATVTVNRIGNNSGVATVDYATSDLAGLADCNALNSGKASSRCDYATAIGRLSFAAGESSKPISVLIVDDGYGEGDEQFHIILSNAVGANLGASSTATVTINDNETVNGGNPINQPGFFVREHYLDFFSREPDPSGLAFWTNEITSCGADTDCIELKRINVSGAFFLSIEFQQTGYLVYRMYKAAYGNVPDTPVPVRFNEFLPDTQQIGLGVVVGQTGWEQVLENNKNLFAADFVGRPRFATAHPTTRTAEEFVDTLFLNAGVIPTPAERTAAMSEFGSGDTAGRARVLRRVAENPTLAQQEFNRAFVLMQYLGYLRRNPNDAPDNNFDGYNFWLGKLNQFNGNFVNAEMVKAFIVAGEYKQRFGP